MNNQILLSIISGIFISCVASYLGTLMLSKKMSVVAGPLAHLSLPGAALAIIFGVSLFYGVFPFVILGAIFIWLLERKTKLPMENLSAIIFAFGVGTALLILPTEQADSALVGSIDTISLFETIAVVVISCFALCLTKIIYPKMMLANIHEDIAQTEGVNVGIYNLLYLLNIGIVVSLSVYLVGGLITAALIAIPSATAKNFSYDLRSYVFWAIFIGSIATLAGIFLNNLYNLPTGPLIIISGVSIFALSAILNKKNYA